MDVNTLLIRSVAVAVAVSILLVLLVRFLSPTVFKRKAHPLPPGPKPWPIVGAIPLLGTSPHVSLAQMANKYGPIMYLKMGSRGMVVASSPEAAELLLKGQDHNLLDRAPDGGSTTMAYNNQSFVFVCYGSKWKLFKSISSHHMLGPDGLAKWAQVRATEVGHMLRAIYETRKSNQPIVVLELLIHSIANMVSQVIFNKRLFVAKGSDSDDVKDLVLEVMWRAEFFHAEDYLPLVAWLDPRGVQSGRKRLHKRWDKLLSRLIEDHVGSAHQRSEPNILDDLLAATNQQNSDGEGLHIDNVKGLLLDMFVAGAGPPAIPIEWALAEMLNNPNILKRAQDEMDQVIGRSRRLVESDLPQLPYLQAICKETLRKHPSVPVMTPRIATDACVVNGYYIPKGTSVSANIWAIGRDPGVWESPEEFRPERFLEERHSKKYAGGSNFELIPFGYGRRMCAGYRMANVVVGFMLGSLIHSFDWKLPEGVVVLDMEEELGITLRKAVALSAVATPRLEPTAYAF